MHNPRTGQRIVRRRLLRAAVASLGAGFFPVLARAQGAATEIRTTDLGGGLSLLRAGTSNVLALRGDAGALMVDGGSNASADALLRAVSAATGNDRVATLILTHGHPEQTGANEIVARSGGTIVASEKTRTFLSHARYTPEGRVEPLPEIARPTKAVRADETLSFAGRRVDCGYLPAAHTDGDLFVHFPELDVLAAGGVVSAERWPLLDYRNGAWFGGRVRALQRLTGIVKPGTRVVPAEGRLLTGRDIAHQREIYDALFETMIGYMNMGLGAEDVVERNPLAPYERELGPAAEFLDGAFRSMQLAYVPD
jgi:glyoxylase-like metal-dependent hydrolase (beta-lactamase superfamily II)